MNEVSQIMIDAICENPSDKALAALADLLIENGHPAGEVIAAALADPILQEFKGWCGGSGLAPHLKYAESDAAAGYAAGDTIQIFGRRNGNTKGRNAIRVTVTRVFFAAGSIHSEAATPVVQVLVVPRQKRGKAFGYTRVVHSAMTPDAVSLIRSQNSDFGCYWL